jgi:hypothetical protein
LQELDPETYYGAYDYANKTDVVFNYTVFDRSKLSRNENRTGYSVYFNVHIVRENFIPEGLVIDYIHKMEEIPGVRFAGNDCEFVYTTKPNTSTVIEMASLVFVRSVKGVRV